MVSYAEQTVDARNPLVRWTHRRRLAGSAASVAELAPAGGTVLDFGSGPGTLLHDVSIRRPDLSLIGYDPYQASQYPTVTVLDDPAVLGDGSVDVVTVFETFEHLYPDEITSTIALARRVLRPDGVLVVSVPIIGGLSLLPKELNRYRLHRRQEYRPAEFARAVLGRPVTRPDDIKISHKGFDFRTLTARLEQDLVCRRSWVSPFPRLPWALNSQHFSVWVR